MSTTDTAHQELAELRARLESLERERQAERAQRAIATRTRRRLFVATAAVAGLGLATSLAWAANGACPNGMPYCFSPDTPALASEVNTNFSQLKEWTEQKVGTVGTTGIVHTGNVRIQTGGTSNVSTANGKTLFASGSYGDGVTNNGGIEFRHDNLSQGIGFGYNTIYATGSGADQPLQLKGYQNGSVNLLSATVMGSGATVNGSGLTVNGPESVTGALTVGGDFVANGNSHGACYATAYECGWIYCASGYYMVGLDIAENENCGGGGDYDFSPFALHCCRL